MDIGSITAAFTAAKNALEIFSGAVAARDEAKIASAVQGLKERVTEINDAMFELAMKNLAAVQQIQALEQAKRDLEAKAAQLEQQAAERSQYRLHELADRVFAYASQNAGADSAPAHYLCQPCLDNRAKKAVLQRVQRGYTVYLTCPECHNDYPTGEEVPVAI